MVSRGVLSTAVEGVGMVGYLYYMASLLIWDPIYLEPCYLTLVWAGSVTDQRLTTAFHFSVRRNGKRWTGSGFFTLTWTDPIRLRWDG